MSEWLSTNIGDVLTNTMYSVKCLEQTFALREDYVPKKSRERSNCDV